MLKNIDIFTRKYKTLDVVKNIEDGRILIVLSEIPFDAKDGFGVPKLKRAYICSETNRRNWTVEYGENLRIATIYDQK